MLIQCGVPAGSVVGQLSAVWVIPQLAVGAVCFLRSWFSAQLVWYADPTVLTVHVGLGYYLEGMRPHGRS